MVVRLRHLPIRHTYTNTWASGVDPNRGEDAVFQGNGGTVTVSGTPSSVNSINFNTDWRTLGSTAPGYQWIPTYTLNADATNSSAITLICYAVITTGAGTDTACPDGSRT